MSRRKRLPIFMSLVIFYMALCYFFELQAAKYGIEAYRYQLVSYIIARDRHYYKDSTASIYTTSQQTTLGNVYNYLPLIVPLDFKGKSSLSTYELTCFVDNLDDERLANTLMHIKNPNILINADGEFNKTYGRLFAGVRGDNNINVSITLMDRAFNSTQPEKQTTRKQVIVMHVD